MSVALSLDRVSKRYRLGTSQGSLRDLIASLCQRVGRNQGEDSPSEYIWALRDLSLELPTGGVLGVIGSNGAGKTTLLKLLSRITKPTTGRLDVHGRMSSLIELGAGFHPELTGRENIFLNGSILGLSRKEIQARYQNIVEFAELERFIDTPVKRYSSGMYARLGFAVAAHTDPDVLVVDEVLSVGDGPFQKKCLDFMYRFVAGEKTVVFVSHNMVAIEQLCTQVLWIDRGQLKLIGAPRQVLPAYFDAMDQQALLANRGDFGEEQEIRTNCLRITDDQGNERDVLRIGEDIIIHVQYRASRPIEKPHFCIGITGPEGGTPIFQASMLIDGQAPSEIRGTGWISCRFRSIPLQPRTYQIWLEVWDAEQVAYLHTWKCLGSFRVASGDEEQAVLGKGGLRHLRTDAPVRVAYEWNIAGGPDPGAGSRVGAHGGNWTDLAG